MAKVCIQNLRFYPLLDVLEKVFQPSTHFLVFHILIKENQWDMKYLMMIIYCTILVFSYNSGLPFYLKIIVHQLTTNECTFWKCLFSSIEVSFIMAIRACSTPPSSTMFLKRLCRRICDKARPILTRVWVAWWCWPVLSSLVTAFMRSLQPTAIKLISVLVNFNQINFKLITWLYANYSWISFGVGFPTMLLQV